MLINKQGIVDAVVSQEPWEHILVDNFVDSDTFDKLFKISQYLLDLGAHRRGKENIFHLDDLRNCGVSEELLKVYSQVGKNLEDTSIREAIWNKFSTHRGITSTPMYCKCSVHCTSPGYVDTIHADSVNKSVSITLYVDPEEQNGTTLYESNNRESTSNTVQWRKNRALIFCPGSDTWHSYIPQDSNHRTVFTMFLEFEDQVNFPSEFQTLTFEDNTSSKWISPIK